MKLKDIEVGKEYAVGRSRYGRKRAVVLAVGVTTWERRRYGDGYFKSRGKGVLVQELDGETGLGLVHEKDCNWERVHHADKEPTRAKAGEPRTLIYRPQDVLVDWPTYAEQKAEGERRKAQAEREAAERARSTAALQQALLKRGILTREGLSSSLELTRETAEALVRLFDAESLTLPAKVLAFDVTMANPVGDEKTVRVLMPQPTHGRADALTIETIARRLTGFSRCVGGSYDPVLE